MSTIHITSIAFALAAVAAWSTPVRADDRITCESEGNRYQRCPISRAGYVSISRQLSSNACVKGRNWDYDRREIWVDDGCRAQFTVDTSSHSHDGGHGDHDGEKVAGAIVGVAILGALINNARHKDDSRYNDDDYQGSRHSSYVPRWMQGSFSGYNPQYDADVTLTIDADGRARVRSGGQTFTGWISNEELHVGNTVFDIDQTRDGFRTSQVGQNYNEVEYRRVR